MSQVMDENDEINKGGWKKERKKERKKVAQKKRNKESGIGKQK